MKPNTSKTLKNKVKNNLFIILSILIAALIFSISATCNQCEIKPTTTSTSLDQEISKQEQRQGQQGQSQQQSQISTTTTTTTGSGQNHNPVINSISVSEGTIFCNSTVDVWVDATDPDGDNLSYNWEIADTNSSIQNTNSSHTTWRASSVATQVKIVATVTDGRGGRAEDVLLVDVVEYSDGGQQQPDEDENLQSFTLLPDTSNSGTIIGGTQLRTDTIIVGDYQESQCKGYVSFDISEVAQVQDLEINEVILTCKALVSGNPEQVAQYLNIKHHNFGRLELDDFFDLHGTVLKSINITDIQNQAQAGREVYYTFGGETIKEKFINAINNYNSNPSNRWFQIKLRLSDTAGGRDDFLQFHFNIRLLINPIY